MVPKVSNTLRALHEIRDEVKELRGEVKELRDDVNDRVGSLEQRQTETEIRLSTELGAVTRTLVEVRDLLRDRLDDRHRVDEHERRIQALERALPR
jgi:uncharacterized coiled-coil DUF342 family protein